MKNFDRNNAKEYYYFNDQAKEVCFKKQNTPTPWVNYLSNGSFHTMISQAGGGLSFYKSPQIWRINRYRFFHLPTDRSGHYIYLLDRETGEYWCPTCEPAQLKPEKWESAHGMGYTRFNAERSGIVAELTYFVGELEDSLIWNLKLVNKSCKPRKLSVFAYVELSIMEPVRELQWQCYMKHMLSVRYLKDSGALAYYYNDAHRKKPDETPIVYLAADRQPNGYDGDRDEFIDSYRSESNPYAVEQGGCTNSTLLGGDPCGALQFDIVIEPENEQELNIFLGVGFTDEQVEKSIENSRKPGFVAESFEKLNKYWSEYLNKFTCTIPDEEAARQINTWNPYQAYRNFQFSRDISYYATGTARGVGFRDTAQDILARIPFDIEASKEKIRLLLKEQYKDGHVNHYFFPNEGYDPVTSIHSDDHLWPILSVWSLVMEYGDLSFLDEKISYFDGGEGTVFEHLCNAIQFTENNLGLNGFPLMLRSDWNDVLYKVCREGKGESIWTSMQFGLVLQKMAELAQLTGREQYKKQFDDLYCRQKKLVNDIGWDGQWFRRAVMDDGKFLGTVENPEAKLWLNSQTWAIYSGMADVDKGYTAMDSVKEILDTELGIKKIYPPIITFPDPKDPLTTYNPGTGENGSIFCHANTWAIIAECMLGRGDIAYKYYRQLLPNIVMDKAGIRRYKAEPYVYSSNIFGPESDKFGFANVSWLTGTAAWMYIAATQYILGVRPVWDGLLLDPCLPSDWKQIKIEREFRGCRYDIEIINLEGVNKGVKHIEVDGMTVEGCVIPHAYGRLTANVRVTMG